MERRPLTEFLSIRRPLTPSYLSSLADVTTSANFAIAVCSRPARPRFHISKDLGRPRSGDVAAFLGKTRAIQAVTRRQARLVFALDATASREATWEHARRLHGELFDAASTATSLAVQLCYYRGIGEFRASRWLTESGALLDQMSRVTCEAGVTQIGRVLTHALEAGSATHPIRAVIFVGDACEESPESLLSIAGRCGVKKIPLFLFQEGGDPTTRAVFQRMATLSGGATVPFDAGSAEHLRLLLGAVARFARGGLKALSRADNAGDRLLLEQLEKKP